jgi:hypothetical protein
MAARKKKLEPADPPLPEGYSFELPNFTLWATTREELLRAWVVVCFSDVSPIAEYDGNVLVNNMDLVYKWLDTGAVPPPPGAKKPKHLTVVKPKPEDPPS